MIDKKVLLERLLTLRGGLIEMLVCDAGVDGWRKAVEILRETSDQVIFGIDGQPCDAFEILPSMFDEANFARYELTAHVGRQVWTTGFFSSSFVDLQGDPREIDDESDVESILQLMERISSATGKTVSLYPEGGYEIAAADSIVEVNHNVG